MSFTGKFKAVSHDNFEAFMRTYGLPEEYITAGKDAETITEIEQNDKTFKVTETTGKHVLVNTFTLGQECELTTITGEKVKTVVNCENCKLRVCVKGVDCVLEMADANTLVDTMTCKGVVYKRVSERI